MSPPSDAPIRNGGRSSRSPTKRLHVAGEGRQPVVLLGRPVGLAVAAGVERDRPPAPLGQGVGGAAPRVPGLATTVQEHHRGGARLAPLVAHQADARRHLRTRTSSRPATLPRAPRGRAPGPYAPAP